MKSHTDIWKLSTGIFHCLTEVTISTGRMSLVGTIKWPSSQAKHIDLLQINYMVGVLMARVPKAMEKLTDPQWTQKLTLIHSGQWSPALPFLPIFYPIMSMK